MPLQPAAGCDMYTIPSTRYGRIPATIIGRDTYCPQKGWPWVGISCRPSRLAARMCSGQFVGCRPSRLERGGHSRTKTISLLVLKSDHVPCSYDIGLIGEAEDEEKEDEMTTSWYCWLEPKGTGDLLQVPQAIFLHIFAIYIVGLW
jgi:hypothetical protein